MTEIKFTSEQEIALDTLGDTKDYYTLKGYAGTGKTTVITYWVQQMRKPPDPRPRFWRAPKIVLTAPTNKATGVLKDKVEDLDLPCDTSTIHSLLGLKMKWQDDEQILVQDSQNEDQFGDYDWVVIDETSMINEELLGYICRAQKKWGNKIIFMGDPCQLPPINEVESRSFNVPTQSELTQIVRQSSDNPIVELSIYLRDLILSDRPHYPNKLFTYVDDNHIFYHPVANYEDDILEAFAEPGKKDIRHVAWTNKVVDLWNNKIRDRIYGFDREDWTRGELIVTTAPVLDPDADGIVFSTDTLLKIALDPILEEHKDIPCWRLVCRGHKLWVVAPHGVKAYRERKNELLAAAKQDRKKWRDFYNFMESFSSVKPAHSLTVHRSQGSTFDDVYVSSSNILTNPRRKESLQCLYVAITRPRSRLFLV